MQRQEESSGSTLQFTRRLLALRRNSKVLRSGETENLHVQGDVLVFDRVADDEVLRVLVNFTGSTHPVDLVGSTLVISSVDRPTPGELAANEAAIYRVR